MSQLAISGLSCRPHDQQQQVLHLVEKTKGCGGLLGSMAEESQAELLVKRDRIICDSHANGSTNRFLLT